MNGIQLVSRALAAGREGRPDAHQGAKHVPPSQYHCVTHRPTGEQRKLNRDESWGRRRSLQVAEAAQDADQVRGGVLRAGRPGVQAHHEALPHQLGGAAGAQPRAGQPSVEGRHNHRLLHAIASVPQVIACLRLRCQSTPEPIVNRFVASSCSVLSTSLLVACAQLRWLDHTSPTATPQACCPA